MKSMNLLVQSLPKEDAEDVSDCARLPGARPGGEAEAAGGPGVLARHTWWQGSRAELAEPRVSGRFQNGRHSPHTLPPPGWPSCRQGGPQLGVALWPGETQGDPCADAGASGEQPSPWTEPRVCSATLHLPCMPRRE